MSPCIQVLTSLLLTTTAWAVASDPEVSPSGFFVQPAGALHSPLGSMRALPTPVAGDVHQVMFDVQLATDPGPEVRLRSVAANSFFPSDVGVLVAVDGHESNHCASRIQLIDTATGEVSEQLVVGLKSPGLSPDGRWLAYGSSTGTTLLDLHSGVQSEHPRSALHTAGPGGQLALWDGQVLAVEDAAGRKASTDLPVSPVDLVWAEGGDRLWVATSGDLLTFNPGTEHLARVARMPRGARLRDLQRNGSELWLGLQRRTRAANSGFAVRMSPDGSFASLGSGSGVSVPLGQGVPPSLAGLPWPMGSGTQRSVGNTYGEYQRYGTSPYMHPGVDVMGADLEPVYAVADGQVKAVLTTSGVYHWRVAIADSAGGGTSSGYLYAHLDLPTIAVAVGDMVQAGDYLGDLVPWPVADFTHCHFARIEDSGAQWFGDWLCTSNPHEEFSEQTESSAPFFENALGNDLFAFCVNDSSSYLDPQALFGQVDIIAHVGDLIESTWVCTVQELRYSIWPVTAPNSPVVNDKLSVLFDMPLDTYQGGPIDPFLVDLLYKQDSTCWTEGDYSGREFFHILTNSDGDAVYEPSDVAESWDTGLVPDGDYVIEVVARDTAGNETSASMIVTVDNG